MKLFLTCTCCLIIALSSCHSGGTGTTAPSADSAAAEGPKDIYAVPKGTFTGDFGGAPIFITINFLNGKQAAGYNVLKGLRRNIHGAMKEDGNGWTFELSEPGDNPYDGKFTFTINGDGKQLNGSWTPFNEKKATAKSFTLKRFEHDGSADQIQVYGTYEGENGSGQLTINQDGSCEMKYYPAINDSTREDQAIQVRGSYTWAGTLHSKLIVNWHTNSSWPQKTTTFDVEAEDMGYNEKPGYMVTAIKKDSLNFTFLP